MKRFKWFFSIVTAFALVFVPLSAPAADDSPGSWDVDKLLSNSSTLYIPAVERVLDPDEQLTALEKGNLERILEHLYQETGVNFLFEYFLQAPQEDYEAGAKTRAGELLEQSSPGLYFTLASQDREFWLNSNAEYYAPGEAQNEILNNITIPEFVAQRYQRGVALSAMALAELYSSGTFSDYAVGDQAPADAFTQLPPDAEPDITSTPASRASAQAKLDALGGVSNNSATRSVSGSSSGSSEGFLTGVLILLGLVVGVPVVIFLLVKLNRAGQNVRLRKAVALERAEKIRIQKLVDQLAPRLVNSEEFVSAASDSERKKIAERASFMVFGLKAVDKDKVIETAQEQVLEALANGGKFDAAYSSDELMRMSIQAFAEQHKHEKKL